MLLDGESLSQETLHRLSRGGADLDLSPEAWTRVEAGRGVIDGILESGEIAYGINTGKSGCWRSRRRPAFALAAVKISRPVCQTRVSGSPIGRPTPRTTCAGFGLFSNVNISGDKLVMLQENLIRSHAAGVGPPISASRTRMLLALRLNVLAKGHSGITRRTVEQAIAAFNAGCLSVVPAKGTVGASGDLAPLSHLALGLMGASAHLATRPSDCRAADAASCSCYMRAGQLARCLARAFSTFRPQL